AVLRHPAVLVSFGVTRRQGGVLPLKTLYIAHAHSAHSIGHTSPADSRFPTLFRGDARIPVGTSAHQPPEVSTSAAWIISRCCAFSSWEASQSWGRCTFFADPARPRGPSAGSPG